MKYFPSVKDSVLVFNLKGCREHCLVLGICGSERVKLKIFLIVA
jgi:hypothetical protein